MLVDEMITYLVSRYGSVLIAQQHYISVLQMPAIKLFFLDRSQHIFVPTPVDFSFLASIVGVTNT